MPDKPEVRTRTCCNEGCTETLTYINGAPITEEFAIALGMWLTVTAESVTPEGVRVDCKTFCSTSCLSEYLKRVTEEYERAEDRVLIKMSDANWHPQGNA
jgi:hypothetical protein